MGREDRQPVLRATWAARKGVIDLAGEGRYTSKATATNPGTNTATVPADPRRVWIGFVAVSGLGNVTLTTTADNGVAWSVQPPTTGLQEFWWERHGSIVALSWTMTVAMGVTGNIVELLDLQYQPEG